MLILLISIITIFQADNFFARIVYAADSISSSLIEYTDQQGIKYQLNDENKTAVVGKQINAFTNVDIPNQVIYNDPKYNVTEIGLMAFYQCDRLVNITMQSSVTSIGDNAFEGCINLSGTIIIPNGVTNIGEYEFHQCRSLTSIVMPSSVTVIGTDTSQRVSYINMYLAERHCNIYSSTDGVLFIRDKSTLPPADRPTTATGTATGTDSTSTKSGNQIILLIILFFIASAIVIIEVSRKREY